MTSTSSSASPVAQVTLHTAFHRGSIDRRLFGSFIEHMGRCVYTGVYEPDHSTADPWGFRKDVAELVEELGVSLVRYPGGNFVSGYDWLDGVGPVADRPRRLDLAWRSIETNEVGPDEFLPWARRLNLEPMMAVNLGTKGVAEAAALVEYCNVESGTHYADLRRANGTEDPHAIKLWCLGNEMDGEWQIGHKDADDYGKLAAEAGKAMRLVDPSIELVACGSSNREMDTFGEWERTVLEHTWDVADYLSMHAYYDGRQTREDFLASGFRMDRFISDVIATADAVGARRRSDKVMKISFDEWNVWSSRPDAPVDLQSAISTQPKISEDPYQALDAVVVGDLLISLLNHSDRVTVACLSLLVNVSAPIMTEPGGGVSRQTTFHPMATTARLAQGTSLVAAVDCGQVSTPTHGDISALGVAASHDAATDTVSVFLVNRSDAELGVSVIISDAAAATVLSAVTVRSTGSDADYVAPGADSAAPQRLDDCRIVDGRLVATLQPGSWSAVALSVGAGAGRA
jgi:alpha-N-arabinofuranosidase